MKISLNRVALNFILIGPSLLCEGEISWCLNSCCWELIILPSRFSRMSDWWHCKCEETGWRGGLGRRHPSRQRRLRASCEGCTSRIGLVSESHLGWRRPFRSSSPTVNVTLPSPQLKRVLKRDHVAGMGFSLLDMSSDFSSSARAKMDGGKGDI